MMISIVAIAIGASLGALLRWYLANRLNATFPQLPPGTLVANILGAYLIGISIAVFLTFPALSPQWRLLTVTGFLGGLTTFSTFSAEVVTAILDGGGRHIVLWGSRGSGKTTLLQAVGLELGDVHHALSMARTSGPRRARTQYAARRGRR